MNAELGFSYGLLNDSYAASVAGLSVGCVMFVPFALKFGRRPVYLVTGFIMAASGAWMAETHTVGDLMGTNILSGLAGAVNETLFQITVGFFSHTSTFNHSNSHRSRTCSSSIKEVPTMVYTSLW